MRGLLALVLVACAVEDTGPSAGPHDNDRSGDSCAPSTPEPCEEEPIALFDVGTVSCADPAVAYAAEAIEVYASAVIVFEFNRQPHAVTGNCVVTP